MFVQNRLRFWLFLLLLFAGGGVSTLFASEADLKVPVLTPEAFNGLALGLVVCVLGLAFGLWVFFSERGRPVHKAMKEIGSLIFTTCKTYLLQQGRLLILLEVFIAVCIGFYFGFLRSMPWTDVAIILGFSVIGILGSYLVAWFGIRMNTLANARTAFASLERQPLKVLNIPLRSGMSIGVLLVSVELILMLSILLFVPGGLAGYCFIGFAIGESLGASALRVAGGIFTKIADIGSDLMKIVFGIKEDDPRNPGVIADCTGDNAGDSVGPTADGFETYGVTGVALISFILLGVLPTTTLGQNLAGAVGLTREGLQLQLLVWIFSMRVLMLLTSLAAYFLNGGLSQILFGKKKEFDTERPLTNLIWIAAVLSIGVTYAVSALQLGPLGSGLWWILATIISCGTLGAALIPEFTKIFTSPKSGHVREIVAASQEGGASLNILSGLVSGNFSAFWIGLLITGLMAGAYFTSLAGLATIVSFPAVFAFGLVAFGFLGMGPVTIAVDSYGPVTDNAQSVYELSLIEETPGAAEEIERDYGFRPDFENAKHLLEVNDGAGNTFKATAKPVLIATAVVGATTMVFSLILVIQNYMTQFSPGNTIEGILSILNPFTLFGFLAGGAVIYWFSGASMQAVITGSYRAVAFIKRHIHLDPNAEKKASTENSKSVVRICTQYAQKGMFNIFLGVFFFALAFAFLASPQGGNDYHPVSFFVSYLIGISVFGLFQAIFMANAGGAWDNAKKIVEVDLGLKNTPLHAASVIGDTVGDPFKDTSSVAMNPIIKFTTLFGLLAMEIALSPSFQRIAPWIGGVFLAAALIFVWRSFYGMRIPLLEGIDTNLNGINPMDANNSACPDPDQN
ncbi:MAG: sodium-translocating pyrophosphatase [Spirochaetales bacterium]|nr:sodium-translocating pyrophosphatase [Spirochaetales bacterium]